MTQSIVLLCCDKCAPMIAQKLDANFTAQGKKVAHFAPLATSKEEACGPSLCRKKAIELIAQGKKKDLLSELIDRAEEAGRDADILIIKPMDADGCLRMAYDLNLELAQNLDACVVPAVCAENKSDEELLHDLELNIKLLAQEGLNVSVLASPCSESVSKIMESREISVFNPKDPKICACKIVPSSNITTPTKFMKSLLAKAKAAQRTIVMPEGNVDRIILAAADLQAKQLVKLVLLGNPEEIKNKADELNVKIEGIELIDPAKDPAFDDYANTLFELRKAKGMTLEQAQKLMATNTFFGTMMVYKGRAHGMVSGATTSTADTIRPALQFIKTKPGIKTVSGVFLMCLPDRVYLYGDCAVIPNATTEQLRDVAIASAATAKSFGIDPKIAMLSYSTGNSGFGPDVDAVKDATQKVRDAAPELAVEGPIQYDAAVVPSVAKTKLPNSAVAGKANVFVFPTLNAGNIAYKAVQRAANAIAIGPILQGLNKPVNDLSRGATVEDIINTVIVTAIQD